MAARVHLNLDLGDRRLMHSTPTTLLSRGAVAGMVLAVCALGALTIWAAVATKDSARTLSRIGVQSSGHLRAVQALSVVDAQVDLLETTRGDRELARLRAAQRVLAVALARMREGDVSGSVRAAQVAGRVMERIRPALERFLVSPTGSAAQDSAEDDLEEALSDLQAVLNSMDADPAAVIDSELAEVGATERTVRRTAFVIVPLGLCFAAACAWTISVYRRRWEASMSEALATTADQAMTDELTGIGNRRRLLAEAERVLAEATLERPVTLAIFDLDGFKSYNDSFGHPAGDELLRRLGSNLAQAVVPSGEAYRLGGDEFCVLLQGDVASHQQALAAATAALSEAGESFTISASHGSVVVPQEARGVAEALAVADRRLYIVKDGRTGATPGEASIVLREVLLEREPELDSHHEVVGRLALDVARRLGLDAAEQRFVVRAAELHDIGKLAIPDAILHKAGPLTAEETRFMRRHVTIGARFLASIPRLEATAMVVRSSHERYDGCGYPDGLAGNAIPLASRIVSACDAYDAMTGTRPYREAMSAQAALAELRRHAGTQFDPGVVAALCAGQELAFTPEVSLA